MPGMRKIQDEPGGTHDLPAFPGFEPASLDFRPHLAAMRIPNATDVSDRFCQQCEQQTVHAQARVD